MSLQAAIDEIQKEVRVVGRIAKAPNKAPDKITTWPFAVAFPSIGSWNGNTPEDMIGLHDIILEIHVGPADKELPAQIEEAMKFSESVPNAIFAARKNSTFSKVETFDEINYIFGALEWNGGVTRGWRFTITKVKTRVNIT